MDVMLLVGRLVLALVFLISAVAKLLDLDASRQAMRNFGVPGPLARVAGPGLPVVELFIAVLLVPQRTAWVGATAALMLLLVFIGAISHQLARGRTPECHCFGALDSGPVGARTLVRNALLSFLALAVGMTGWQNVWATLTEASALTLAVLIIGVSVLLLIALQVSLTLVVGRRLSARLRELTAEVSSGKARANRRRLGELVPVAMGEPAPKVELPDLAGELIDLGAYHGRETLLVFVRPGCWACHALLPDLKQWDEASITNDFRLVVISRGTVEENQDLTGMRSPVLLSPNASVAQAFGIGGTPAALFLDPDGVVASDVVLGIGPVSSLLRPDSDGSPEAQPSSESSQPWGQPMVGLYQRLAARLRGAGT